MTIFIDDTLDCGIRLAATMNCIAVGCFSGDLACTQSADLYALVKSFRIPTSFNLRIPPFALLVGTYHFSCEITMTVTGFKSTIGTTLQIVRSPIVVTLLPVGISKILLGYNEKYTFSPSISNTDIAFEVDQHLILIFAFLIYFT